MLRILLILLLVLVLCLGASVGYYNSQQVEFDYLAGKIEVPLIALLIAEFGVAVLLTLLVCYARVFSLKSEIRRQRKQLRDAEAELKNLRNLPLKDA